MQNKDVWSAEKPFHIQNTLGERLLSKKMLPAAVLIAAVCATVAAVHWPALSARALSFDDGQYLTENVLVQNPSWKSAKRFLTEVLAPSTVMGYYQPLAMISLMFDYALGGRENNLMPFHRTSLVLHCANTALIIVLLYLLFGNIWVAAGVGLLFGVHPMTVEPIPWVGERKTLLAAFFSLWSLILYVYPRVTNHQRRAAKFYIGSFVMYLLALMSKPTSTPLPVVMLLMDYWLLRRLNWRAIFEKIPFFMLGGIFAVITYISQSRTAGSGSPAEIGLGRILLVISHNIIFYLNKMIWPVNLSSHYAFPEPLNLSQPMVLAGVIGTCILIPLLLLSLRRTRAVLTGWLIFFLAILPTMQIIGFTNVIASDKFAYLPSIGLLMILAAFLVWLCRSRFLVLCRMAAVIILVLACGEAVATRRYLVCWQDTIKLYEHMLALTPNAPTVHYNIAVELKALGRIDEAIAHYRRAIEIRPDYAEAHNNLGVIVQSRGNLGEAISHYREALRNKPDYAEAYYNLGVTYSKLGRYEESIQAYRKAITIKPDSVEANNNLGSVYGKIGEWQKSAEAFQKAAEVEPNFIPYYNVGIAYERLARYKEAIEAYKQAVKIKPEHSGAHYSLGAAYLAIGDNNSALEEYKILKTLNPEQAGRLLNLIHK